MANNCFEIKTDERHLRNFTFLKYQQTNGWLSCKLLKLTKPHMHINVSFSPQVSISFKNIKYLKSESWFSTLQLLWNRIKTHSRMKKYASLDVWCCGAAFSTNWTPLSWESSHVLCTRIAKDDLIIYSLWHQNKYLIVWNNFQSLVTQHPFKHDLIPMTHLLMKKGRANLINLESLLLSSILKVKSTVKEVCLVIWSVQCDKWLLSP